MPITHILFDDRHTVLYFGLLQQTFHLPSIGQLQIPDDSYLIRFPVQFCPQIKYIP